jgi:ribosome-binding protein aMBF1 (putative translation factor)
MTPEDIKAAISRNGTSQAAIAEYLKVTPSVVGRVVSGKARSQRVEAEIEKAVGRKNIFGPRGKPGPIKTTWNGKARVAAA